jgi:hypothetical protein
MGWRISTAALAYVAIVGACRAVGLPIPQFDAQIAVIARHSGAKVATCNTEDVGRCGIVIVNPWVGPGGRYRDLTAASRSRKYAPNARTAPFGAVERVTHTWGG